MNLQITCSKGQSRTPWKLGPRFYVLAALAAILLAPIAGQRMLQNSNPHLPPELNRIPDGNQVNDINAGQLDNQSFETANAERKRRIDSDTTKLVKLAADLKVEINKAGNNTLSLDLIRKAEEIEKLARRVQETMKQTAGTS
jgi:hypothetical protein